MYSTAVRWRALWAGPERRAASEAIRPARGPAYSTCEGRPASPETNGVSRRGRRESVGPTATLSSRYVRSFARSAGGSPRTPHRDGAWQQSSSDGTPRRLLPRRCCSADPARRHRHPTGCSPAFDRRGQNRETQSGRDCLSLLPYSLVRRLIVVGDGIFERMPSPRSAVSR
jgi:hypothetical protein